jgi:carbonic anhydrase
MKALLNPSSLKEMPQVRTWLRHASQARLGLPKAQLSRPSAETLVTLTKLNVRLQLDRLSVHPKVQPLLRSGELALHGWYYRIASGEVEAWQPSEARWIAVQDSRDSLSLRRSRGMQAVRHA